MKSSFKKVSNHAPVCLHFQKFKEEITLQMYQKKKPMTIMENREILTWPGTGYECLVLAASVYVTGKFLKNKIKFPKTS